jgi:hypothetical protein
MPVDSDGAQRAWQLKARQFALKELPPKSIERDAIALPQDTFVLGPDPQRFQAGVQNGGHTQVARRSRYRSGDAEPGDDRTRQR